MLWANLLTSRWLISNHLHFSDNCFTAKWRKRVKQPEKANLTDTSFIIESFHLWERKSQELSSIEECFVKNYFSHFCSSTNFNANISWHSPYRKDSKMNFRYFCIFTLSSPKESCNWANWWTCYALPNKKETPLVHHFADVPLSQIFKVSKQKTPGVCNQWLEMYENSYPCPNKSQKISLHKISLFMSYEKKSREVHRSHQFF